MTGAWSAWSQPTGFTTGATAIIGICLVTAGNGPGTWARVDADGQPLTGSSYALGGAYYGTHPAWSGIAAATIDGQAMVRIPKHYIKTGPAPAGSPYAGKPCWWVSSQPVEGFELHPAFREAGAEIDQFWLGALEGTNDGNTKVGAIAGGTKLTNVTLSTYRSRCEARGAGWRLWSIYQLAAVQRLMLIEMGGADSQALVPGAGWRGLAGLYGTIWQMVDGVTVRASGNYAVWDRQGHRSWMETGVPAPNAAGWPSSLRADTGSGWDFRDLFIGGTLAGAQSGGSFADQQWLSPNPVYFHGGTAAGEGAGAGLFCCYLNTEIANAGIGGRLAKV